MQAYLPSPPTGVLHLGPFPVRAYAVCIIVGVIVACWLGDRRWVQRGGVKGTVWDVAGLAVPGGITASSSDLASRKGSILGVNAGRIPGQRGGVKAGQWWRWHADMQRAPIGALCISAAAFGIRV